MAIVIPSANIYKIENNKVIDNQIKKVVVEVNKFSEIKYGQTQSVTYDYVNIESDFAEHTNYKDITFTSGIYGGDSTLYGYWVSFNFDFTIDSKIYLLNGLTVNTENSSTDYDDSGNMSETYSIVYQIYNPVSSGDFGFYIVNSQEDFDQKEEKNWGKCGLKRLSTHNFRLYWKVLYKVTKNNIIFTQCNMRNITLYAYEQIKDVDSYGSGENTYINSNELIQNTTKNGTTEIGEYIANNIISKYSNGKETATIKCSINNYYNEDTTIAKSTTDTTKDMVFRLGDEVIPMIRTSNGSDAPMSKKADNTAKIFIVLGSKIYFNGAIWQELTLQEKT